MSLSSEPIGDTAPSSRRCASRYGLEGFGDRTAVKALQNDLWIAKSSVWQVVEQYLSKTRPQLRRLMSLPTGCDTLYTSAPATGFQDIVFVASHVETRKFLIL